MLVKDKNSSELYIHICPDAHKYTRKALNERMTIYRHDISAFIITESGKLKHIKYCPYCGQELDRDTDGTAGQEKKAAKILFAERR